MNHADEAGYSSDSLYSHIVKEYTDELSTSEDKTHGIIPYPFTDIGMISKNELELYDLIVHRFFTIFLPYARHYKKTIEAYNKNQVSLILEKDAYIRYGCDIFELNKERIYEEINIDTDTIESMFSIGTTINAVDLKIQVEGNLTKDIKKYSHKQLINKLMNMGKKMTQRKQVSKLKNYVIGDDVKWKTYIEKLEIEDLIEIDDDKSYGLSKSGQAYIDRSKAYLFDISNLNALVVSMIGILNGHNSFSEVIQEHISTLQSLVNSINMKQAYPANYKYITNNYNCPCGNSLKNHENFLGCSDYPKCKFSLSKSITSGSHYTFTETDLIELLIRKKTSVIIPDFIFKSGKTGNVTFKLNNDNKLQYVFHNIK
jgi:DNA topoisomerase IA